MSMGNYMEILSQQILAGIVLVGRLGLRREGQGGRREERDLQEVGGVHEEADPEGRRAGAGRRDATDAYTTYGIL